MAEDETPKPELDPNRVDIEWENPIYDDDAWRPSYGERTYQRSVLDLIQWAVEQTERAPKPGSFRYARSSPFRLDGWALPLLVIALLAFIGGIAWLNAAQG